MATGTFTVQKPVVRPSRTHDYLYDPVFTVSSERDHMKQAFKAQTSIDRVKQVPHFKTMFSSLRHFPHSSIRLDSTDAVPAHISRHWRGYSDQFRDTLIRYKKFNYDPSLTVPPKHYEDPQVDGQNRYKYFRRPIIPFLQQMPVNVVLEPTKAVDPLAPPTTQREEMMLEGGTRTVHVQTDYRDSETQTEPYTPQYVVKPGEQPELLALASLSWGHGLPAGLAEVEMIERARAKREWERSLPALNDLSQMEKRRRMMEEQERREWEHREKEILKLQQERLLALEKMMSVREDKNKALTEQRLEHLWEKRQKSEQKDVQRLRRHHIQALRKLTEKHRNVEGKVERRDAIKEYSNYNSQVYAPMTRIGVFLDSTAHRYQISSHYRDTLHGLLELEEGLPASMTQLRFSAPGRGERVVGYKARQQQRLVQELDKEHKAISEEKKKASIVAKPLRFLERIEKPPPRPPTPTVEPVPEEEERRELAVIFLQKVMRGRSAQIKMFDGKERRLKLIRELQTTHALQEEGQKEKAKERGRVLSLQQESLRSEHREEMVGDLTEEPVAREVGQQLDFLNKELRRLQEERRVHAFVMLAERQRRMREAEESGHRQVEERVRRREDEVFRQVMLVHQSTVDSYLEDVILESLQKTADQQAREDIRQQADRINRVALECEGRRSELESKELVAEMVASFLLPEVEKQINREKVREHQRRHILAAHRIVHNLVEDSPQDFAAAKENKTEDTQGVPTATAVDEEDGTLSSHKEQEMPPLKEEQEDGRLSRNGQKTPPTKEEQEESVNSDKLTPN